jgi:hypothetical protein
MADISDKELREKVDARMSGLSAMRGPVEYQNEQIARYETISYNRTVRAAKPGVTVTDRAGAAGRKGWLNEKLYNDKAVTASETTGNGMSGGLCSPSQPWFKYRTEDEDLMEYAPVKAWLHDAEQKTYALLARCGFYTAATSGFLEQTLYGTEACVMIPHWEYGAACYPQEWGEYWLGQNDALRVDTLYRDVDMTVAQILAKFPDWKPSRAVQELITNKKLDTIVPVKHGIEPNIERVYGRMDRTNMAYRSIYWERDNDTKDGGIMSFGGFEERPFWAARWDQRGSNVYGRGPGLRVLPQARKLQLQELRKQQAMDYVVTPPLHAPSNMQGGQLRINPRDVNYGAPADRQQVFELWKVDPRAIEFISADIDKTEARIDIGMYVDLFRMFSNMGGSAYRNIEEIARKHEETLRQLGPVVDRAANEKLEPAITQAFNILLRANVFLPPPDELRGVDIKINFDGILIQAQRMVGLGAIERTAGFVGNLLAAFPGVGDKIDADQMVDDYAAGAGAPPRMIRDDKAVAALREQRAAAEQAEKTLAAMPAVNAGAKAAQLLSETDMGGGRSALAALVGGPGV